MSNEVLFVLLTLVALACVLGAARRGTEWLYALVATNLILIGIFGAKLVTVFGITTNSGNIVYAGVFLATHLLIERRGRRAGMQTIGLGIAAVAFVAIMTQGATRLVGLPVSDGTSTALTTLFSVSLRITIASILAYSFAQYVNIGAYEWIATRTRGRYLWLRSNGANIVAQFVDSLLFFSIAFFDLPGPLLVQTIAAGWIVKVLIVGIGTPVLYIDAGLTRGREQRS